MCMSKLQEQVRVLEIRLYDVLVGFLAGYRDGRNIFTFAHEYINLEESSRPTLTLKHYHGGRSATNLIQLRKTTN